MTEPYHPHHPRLPVLPTEGAPSALFPPLSVFLQHERAERGTAGRSTLSRISAEAVTVVASATAAAQLQVKTANLAPVCLHNPPSVAQGRRRGAVVRCGLGIHASGRKAFVLKRKKKDYLKSAAEHQSARVGPAANLHRDFSQDECSRERGPG